MVLEDQPTGGWNRPVVFWGPQPPAQTSVPLSAPQAMKDAAGLGVAAPRLSQR